MKRKKANFLDYIPLRNPKFTWSEENGLVTVDMIHTGVYAAIAQRVFHRPRVSHVRLDAYGSFLWLRMDGETDITALGKQLEEEFGEEAQPLYTRLAKYMQTLYNNQFIAFRRDRANKK